MKSAPEFIIKDFKTEYYILDILEGAEDYFGGIIFKEKFFELLEDWKNS